MKINSTSLIRATVGTIWAIVAMTIASEVSPPFRALLKGFTGHHWTTKSVLSVLIFTILYFVFIKAQESEDVFRGVMWVIASVILGGLVIFLFFIWNFLQE